MGSAVLTATDTSWDWPAGVTQLTAEAIGGGGGGGGETGYPAGGGGGKGGSYAKVVITKGAESFLNITVGALGAAGSGGAGGNGTASTIVQGASTVLSAAGGYGGGGGTTNNHYGTGGTSLNGANTGTVTFEGGNGADGAAGVGSGGGGAAAGPGHVGGPASGKTAGVAPDDQFLNLTIYSGDGGAGVGTAESDGNPGQASPYYGGAGSGGYCADATNHPGGAGRPGVVVLTWSIAKTPTGIFSLGAGLLSLKMLKQRLSGIFSAGAGVVTRKFRRPISESSGGPAFIGSIARKAVTPRSITDATLNVFGNVSTKVYYIACLFSGTVTAVKKAGMTSVSVDGILSLGEGILTRLLDYKRSISGIFSLGAGVLSRKFRRIIPTLEGFLSLGIGELTNSTDYKRLTSGIFSTGSSILTRVLDYKRTVTGIFSTGASSLQRVLDYKRTVSGIFSLGQGIITAVKKGTAKGVSGSFSLGSSLLLRTLDYKRTLTGTISEWAGTFSRKLYLNRTQTGEISKWESSLSAIKNGEAEPTHYLVYLFGKLFGGLSIAGNHYLVNLSGKLLGGGIPVYYRTVSGVLSLGSGVVNWYRKGARTLAGSFRTSGTLSGILYRPWIAHLRFVGSVAWKIRYVPSGTLRFAASLQKWTRFIRPLEASLSIISALVVNKIVPPNFHYYIFPTSSFYSSGSVLFKFKKKVLSSSMHLGPSLMVARIIAGIRHYTKELSGILPGMTGALTAIKVVAAVHHYFISTSGSLRSRGDLSYAYVLRPGRHYYQTLNGDLRMTGEVTGIRILETLYYGIENP